MDTSAARRNILSCIRAAQGRPVKHDAAEIDAAADYLVCHPEGPRPPMPADLVACFVAEARQLSTTVDEVATGRIACT